MTAIKSGFAAPASLKKFRRILSFPKSWDDRAVLTRRHSFGMLTLLSFETFRLSFLGDNSDYVSLPDVSVTI